MKTYSITGAKKEISENILTMARIDQLARYVDKLEEDLIISESESDFEDVEFINEEIFEKRNVGKNLTLKLTDKDVIFLYANDISLIDGEGGKDLVLIEPIK